MSKLSSQKTFDKVCQKTLLPNIKTKRERGGGLFDFEQNKTAEMVPFGILFPLCESESKKTKTKDVKNDVLLVLRNGVNVLDPKNK